MIMMMVAIIVIIAVFTAVFDWFPMTMWQPWAVFFFCFVLCAGGTFGIMFFKVKVENKKMEDGLEFMKHQWEEEQNGKDGT